MSLNDQNGLNQFYSIDSNRNKMNHFPKELYRSYISFIK